MIALKNGQYTADTRLGRVPQIDLRSLNYPVSERLTAAQQANPRSHTWFLSILVLNQGQTSSCVGHGWSHELAARPGVVEGITESYALALYRSAQEHDEWPGEEPTYEGTSVLGGAKAVAATGLIDSYHWALDVADLVAGIGYHGPAVLGVTWTEGMFTPDDHGFIRPTGKEAGRHCLLANGVRVYRSDAGAVNWVDSYFLCPNSWGTGWGDNGYCRVSFIDMATLFANGGEACFAVGRHGATIKGS